MFLCCCGTSVGTYTMGGDHSRRIHIYIYIQYSHISHIPLFYTVDGWLFTHVHKQPSRLETDPTKHSFLLPRVLLKCRVLLFFLVYIKLHKYMYLQCEFLILLGFTLKCYGTGSLKWSPKNAFFAVRFGFVHRDRDILQVGHQLSPPTPTHQLRSSHHDCKCKKRYHPPTTPNKSVA